MDLDKLPGKIKVKKYDNSVTNRPLVSVSVTAYNHEEFIRQCLDGILTQKTNFDFEVLLGEDDSPDSTREICIEYAKKYPDKIRLFLHNRDNVIDIGGKPSGRYNVLYNLSEAKGKYIALCDGDDFWTDPKKLQRQVDFMEEHPDYAVCFHPVQVALEGAKESSIFPSFSTGFTTKKLLKSNYIQTSSVMYRRQKYKNMVLDLMPGDWYFHLYHAQFGKIGFINRAMSVYRKHEGGLWSRLREEDEGAFWSQYGRAHLLFYVSVLRMYGKNSDYLQTIQRNISDTLLAIVHFCGEGADRVLDDAIALNNEVAPALINSLIHRTQQKEQEAVNYKSRIKELEKTIHAREKVIEDIKSSRIWTIRNFIAKLLGKEVV